MHVKEDISNNLKKEIKVLKKNNGKIFYTKTELMSSTEILNKQFALGHLSFLLKLIY